MFADHVPETKEDFTIELECSMSSSDLRFSDPVTPTTSYVCEVSDNWVN